MRLIKIVNNIAGIAVLVLMALMVVAALRDMNGGSLDDLPADEIKDAVDRAVGRRG